MPTSQNILLRSGNTPMTPDQIDAYVNDALFTERDQRQIDFYDQVLHMNRRLAELESKP